MTLVPIESSYICDFLLVGHCDYRRILHRFQDTATYWLKCLFFLALSHSAPSLPVFRLEFRAEVNHLKVMGLSSSETASFTLSLKCLTGHCHKDSHSSVKWPLLRLAEMEKSKKTNTQQML